MGIRPRTWRRSISLALTGLLAVLATAFLAPVASAAETDPALLSPCRYRSGFGSQYYCLVDRIEDVQATRYGAGRRVYLRAVVESYTATTVTYNQIRLTNPCPPGQICGQLLDVSFVRLTVNRVGTAAPPVGYVVRLYGSTVTRSLTATGYVNTKTYCGTGWELCV